MARKQSKLQSFYKQYGVNVLILSLALNLLLMGVLVQNNGGFGGLTQKNSGDANVIKPDPEKAKLFEEINPAKGYVINASLNDLGPKMVELGVIDLEKFKQAYQGSGQSLPADLEKVLTKGTKEKIRITRDNSYFFLNFFWAVGLANKSAILDEGDMVNYGGREGAGNFASTGGWTLSKTSAMDYYSASGLIPLTAEQETLVKNVASNIYRPCCDNSTAFPDCNHGMALLGVLELMASQGASENQMYEAAKYINAFWFPGNYYDLALYFKNKEKKDFSQVDARTVLGREYSSASGWQGAKKWLTDQGIVEAPPKQGNGCGV